jgi:uncharacterized membrane protein
MKKTNRLILMLSIISLILTVIIYPNLPDIIPQHFGPNGEVDRYGPKYMVFIMAIMPIAIYFFMDITRSIDPKKKSYQKHEKAYAAIKLVTAILFIIMNWTMILISLGYNLRMNVIISICIGIMFIVIGNYMTQLRDNFFMGIKNPWTLSDSTVWKKTHRVGGYTFMLLGVVCVLSGLMSIYRPEITFIVFMSITITWTIGINLYSYIIYRKLHNKNI